MRRCDLLPLLFLTTVAVSQPNRSEFFKITVVDAATGRGVPLVELKTEDAMKAKGQGFNERPCDVEES